VTALLTAGSVLAVRLAETGSVLAAAAATVPVAEATVPVTGPATALTVLVRPAAAPVVAAWTAEPPGAVGCAPPAAPTAPPATWATDCTTPPTAGTEDVDGSALVTELTAPVTAGGVLGGVGWLAGTG